MSYFISILFLLVFLYLVVRFMDIRSAKHVALVIDDENTMVELGEFDGEYFVFEWDVARGKRGWCMKRTAKGMSMNQAVEWAKKKSEPAPLFSFPKSNK